jgi:hypothetical protein
MQYRFHFEKKRHGSLQLCTAMTDCHCSHLATHERLDGTAPVNATTARGCMHLQAWEYGCTVPNRLERGKIYSGTRVMTRNDPVIHADDVFAT